MKLRLTIDIPDTDLARLLGHRVPEDAPLPDVHALNRICRAALSDDDDADIPPPAVSPFAGGGAPARCPKCGAILTPGCVECGEILWPVPSIEEPRP